MCIRDRTTPDLKLVELNSSTLIIDSSARLLERWARVGCLGRTTVALSCMRRCDCEKSVKRVLQLLWSGGNGASVYKLCKLTECCQCVCTLQQIMWLTACGCSECQRSAGHCHTSRKADRQTDGQEDRPAGRQKDHQRNKNGRQAGRQAGMSSGSQMPHTDASARANDSTSSTSSTLSDTAPTCECGFPQLPQFTVHWSQHMSNHTCSGHRPQPEPEPKTSPMFG